MPDASKPQRARRCLACALRSRKKNVAIFYKDMFKTNKSTLYRIQINDVALVLRTYSQIARPIGFAVVMRLGSANCLRPVASAYLRRIDSIKLM